MKEYKSPDSRLARIFQISRDNWKERALEKQRKIRYLEVKVRDVTTSRDYWKDRAKEAESKLNEQINEQKREAVNKPKIEPGSEESKKF